jgi:uncharacterized protein (DUF697 family)
MIQETLGPLWRHLKSFARQTGDAASWVQRRLGRAAAPPLPDDGTARYAAAQAEADAPVIWLLGKTQAGKTSIVAALTGEGRDDIGNGFQPATRTARKYAWPPERPLLRFLDTRGLADVASYDPEEDIAFAEGQAHLIVVVVRAEDMALAPVLAPLRAARRRHPDWSVIVAQTRLHDLYPPGFAHKQPWPFDDAPLDGIPETLRSALRHQRAQFAGLPGSGAVRFVPLDFTQPAEGFAPAHYGIEALRHALAEALPLARDVILPPRRDIARPVHGLIVSYAAAAAAAAAVPLPGLGIVGPAVSQSLMLRGLAGRYRLSWTNATWTKFATGLGAGALSGFGLTAGLRELTKLIPVVGQVAGGASAGAAGFATTYALGIAACRLLEAEKVGATIPDRGLADTYAKALREAFTMRREAS